MNAPYDYRPELAQVRRASRSATTALYLFAVAICTATLVGWWS